MKCSIAYISYFRNVVWSSFIGQKRPEPPLLCFMLLLIHYNHYNHYHYHVIPAIHVWWQSVKTRRPPVLLSTNGMWCIFNPYLFYLYRIFFYWSSFRGGPVKKHFHYCIIVLCRPPVHCWDVVHVYSTLIYLIFTYIINIIIIIAAGRQYVLLSTNAMWCIFDPYQIHTAFVTNWP